MSDNEGKLKLIAVTYIRLIGFLYSNALAYHAEM